MLCCPGGTGGATVATGRSVWGILKAPAIGEATAEPILDGGARGGLPKMAVRLPLEARDYML